ncbi:hypothetical protein B0T24DRAFT_695737 [Lasiosphaeria ovina]|uniref:SH3 domain-containing protein n=1 Tax=Lasiosphaeria ovina TaxID=92902 RepID=A0AAE0TSZ2_9PEZI|nr:hypothetical protein B0T24DRAFT_695737 [Lasiosphaeria ovina]
MTRPTIIRADTIDLQAHDAPLTQGYHKPAADGLLAPHQAETLHKIATETAEDQLHSPRPSWNGDDADRQQQQQQHYTADHPVSRPNGQPNGAHNAMQTGSQQDALAIAQNGGISGHEADDGDLDGETDVDMDDDMMDKISSSPSIEDGGSIFTLPRVRSDRSDYVSRLASGSPEAFHVLSEARSSSPYFDQPDHLPLNHPAQQAGVLFAASPCRHHHLYGEFEPHDSADEPPLNTLDGPTEDDFSPDNLPVSAAQAWASDFETGENTKYDQTMLSLPNPQASDDRELVKDLSPSQTLQDDENHAEDNITDEDQDYGGMTVAYESDEDDDGDFSIVDEPRFLDSGWGGECLQDTEDIDFEFVYALHTFVATVEGQANATKGDTMVLLDDSNSYWWLVRIVKDSSIGYLPAEHIETPTERLARLNKHRNIDLSATMLGDQAEKSRNPLKSAMKRRKAKTVQFAGNTYVDYSDNDYSTEEEDVEAEYFAQQQQLVQQSAKAGAEQELDDETAKVEPLKPRSQQKETKIELTRQDVGEADITVGKGGLRASEEIFETKVADGPKKTSDGTVRDSFFKDDTVETKKITLTPNLLRDDNAPRSSGDSRELKQRVSLDKLEKDSPPSKEERKKKDKKEKEKKPSAIRSFFSRKEKKARGEEDDDSFGKPSMDADMQDREMDDEEAQTSPEKGPQRQSSKLQKQQPRIEPSPTRKPNLSSPKDSGMDIVAILSEGKVNNVANVPPASMRIVNPGIKESPEVSEDRPQKAIQAKSRVDMADFDSDEDITPEPGHQAPGTLEASRQPYQQQQYQYQQTRQQPQTQLQPQLQQQPIQGNFTDNYQVSQPASGAAQLGRVAPVNTMQLQQNAERLSESPVEVSPISNPPPLMGDTSSQEEDHSSTRSTPSPELIEHDDGDLGHQDSITTSTSTATAPTWNDVNLRAFFDSGSDIRDLLVVVYDKTDVEPAGSDHPVAGSLFKEQNAKLAEITTQLDNMLGDWLARKQRLRGSV